MFTNTSSKTSVFCLLGVTAATCAVNFFFGMWMHTWPMWLQCAVIGLSVLSLGFTLYVSIKLGTLKYGIQAVSAAYGISVWTYGALGTLVSMSAVAGWFYM